MGEPAITTIVPTFRRPGLLRLAVESVLAQTCSDFKVLVLDNASGDETGDVALELARKDPRVDYVRHPDNIGPFENFQYGLRHVETEFFSFLSDDDLLLPSFFEIALEGFEKHPDAMISGGVTVAVRPPDRMSPQGIIAWAEGRHDPPEGGLQMLRGQAPTWTGLVFRTSVLDEMGLLSEKAGNSADAEFELRIALRFPYVMSLRPCAFFMHRSSSGGFHRPRSPERFYSEWSAIAELLAAVCADDDARQQVRAAIDVKLEEKLVYEPIRRLRRRQFDQAEEAIGILRDRMGKARLARRLERLVWAARRLPFGASIVGALWRARKLFKGSGGRRPWIGLEEARQHFDRIDFSPYLSTREDGVER